MDERAAAVVSILEFYDLAEVHDRHPVAHEVHRRDVVGDEHVVHGVAFRKVLQQVQDLGLGGHVEGTDRLVEHDKPGSAGQCPGYGRPLLLPSR